MGFFDKIKAGLTKTRDALSNTLGSVFSGFSEIDDDFYDELEESLILADLGVDTSVKAAALLRKRVKEEHIKTTEEAKTALKEILVEMLDVGDTSLHLEDKPAVILMIGGQAIGMRSMSLYELNVDYVLYSKLLGVRDSKITMYVFKNAILPQVSGLALSLGGMVLLNRKREEEE